ncbi:hypothetical protein DL767_010262 [Monosporascus sp. MG133]|nr:hypothetical protein DL767_010262 [Monosporascus sp. MG133]
MAAEPSHDERSMAGGRGRHVDDALEPHSWEETKRTSDNSSLPSRATPEAMAATLPTLPLELHLVILERVDLAGLTEPAAHVVGAAGAALPRAGPGAPVQRQLVLVTGQIANSRRTPCSASGVGGHGRRKHTSASTAPRSASRAGAQRCSALSGGWVVGGDDAPLGGFVGLRLTHHHRRRCVVVGQLVMTSVNARSFLAVKVAASCALPYFHFSPFQIFEGRG